MAQKQIDDRDRKLIAILQDNARTPISELARKLDISRNAVQQRLDRMEREGRIAGYTIVLSEPLKAKPIAAIALLQMREMRQDCRRFSDEIKGWPEVRNCYSVAGSEDICLKIEADSTENLSELLLKLSNMERVRHVSSHIVLETLFER